MLVQIKGRMPYHGDRDYQDALITAVRRHVTLIDVSLLEIYGSLEVDIEDEALIPLLKEPLVGEASPVRDVEMRLEGRVYI